ncbi:hypothetical protein OG985_46185 [Streptomyces sp. NBC_00289]|uniref:hypothetical protein n=1 Tax=Streptomyces sp. NBC_00289 TaxID=2975703 RepID=UPI003243439F
MSVFEYQRFVAGLIVDEHLFQDFVQDRHGVLRRYQFDSTDREQLELLDTDELAVFRDVVDGTRAVFFGLIFDELRGRMSDDGWDQLLANFRRQVVVKDSRDSADLRAFCTWLGEEFPGSAGVALARYQMTLQVIGSTPVVDGEPGTLRRASRTAVFRSGFDLDELLETPPDKLWTIGQADGIRHYVLQSSGENTVTVSEVDSSVADLLAYLRRPRSSAEVRVALAGGEDVSDELIRMLVDAGAVVETR